MQRDETPAAIVTGAGSGIGLAICRALAARGWSLALVGRREGPLKAAADSLETPCVRIPADVADPEAARAMVTTAHERFERLDALINNAGYAPLSPIDRTTPRMLQDAFAINALGPANAIAAAWPIFTRQRSGCVVNVSSMATIDPFPGFFAYAAAKAAVNVMVRSCANEGRRLGIRAFAVAPGAVETPMLRENFPESALPPARCLRPEQVAEVVVQCVLGERDADCGRTIEIPSP